MCRGRRSDALGLSRELCGDAPVELDSAGDFSDTPLGYAPHTKWFEVFIADNGAAILPN